MKKKFSVLLVMLFILAAGCVQYAAAIDFPCVSACDQQYLNCVNYGWGNCTAQRQQCLLTCL